MELVLTDYGDVTKGRGVKLSMSLNTLDLIVASQDINIELTLPVQGLLDAVGWQTKRMGN